mgnify:CR=1 FL=1
MVSEWEGPRYPLGFSGDIRAGNGVFRGVTLLPVEMVVKNMLMGWRSRRCGRLSSGEDQNQRDERFGRTNTTHQLA